MNLFQAIGQTINSCVSVIITAARTTEKSVQLVENEVDMLHKEQIVRLSLVGSDLTVLPHKPQTDLS